MRNTTLFALLVATLTLGACGEDFSGAELEGEIPFDPSTRPTARPAFEVDPYTGDDPIVLAAQERIRTGLDLHRKLIWRTCTPNGGVCHNQKEYPDLHTPSNFIGAIGAPCNVSPGEWVSVFDRCERPGDRFNFSGSSSADNEIGYIEFIPGESLGDGTVDNIGDGYSEDEYVALCIDPEEGRDDASCRQDFNSLDSSEYCERDDNGNFLPAPDCDSDDTDGKGVGLLEPEELPGLHIYLHTPLGPRDRDYFYTSGLFIRTFVNDAGLVQELPFFQFETRWTIFNKPPEVHTNTNTPYEGRTHLYARVRNYQLSAVNELLSVGIIQGDLNRNGIFGARVETGTPVAEIVPGNPERSYIIGRMRGVMLGENVPGTRMPLANTPFSVDEMLAFYCFIEGLPDVDKLDATLDWPIDYNRCSFADDPSNLNLLGEGVSWEGRIKKVLEFNCGGCHTGADPADGLDLVSSGNIEGADLVYERLLGNQQYGFSGESSHVPGMKFVVPGDPDNSYLWLKLVGDPSIEGNAMPYNPLTGKGTLSDSELADIKQWIINGAPILAQ